MTWSSDTLRLPLFVGRREAIAKITARFPGIRVEPGPELMVLGPDEEKCRGIRLWVTESE